MTKAEVTLIDLKFILDMYSAGVDTAENALEKVREILKSVVSLTDNQQVVLEWLKWQSKQNGTDPTDSIYLLVYGEAPSSVSTALIDLTKAQQFQVLAAFAEWGMKEVAE